MPDAQHEDLRVVIDTIPGLVRSSLPDGHIDYLNPQWLEYTGLSLESASGWGWQQDWRSSAWGPGASSRVLLPWWEINLSRCTPPPPPPPS